MHNNHISYVCLIFLNNNLSRTLMYTMYICMYLLSAPNLLMTLFYVLSDSTHGGGKYILIISSMTMYRESSPFGRRDSTLPQESLVP